MTIRIVTDSTSDIPPPLAEELGIKVVPVEMPSGLEAGKTTVDIGGVMQTGDGESPFPVQETSKLQGVPVSIVHVLGPVDWGVKRTCTVTDSPAAKLYDPLPDVISKSGQLSLTEPLRVPPPVFVILNDCVEELLPVTTFPNLRVSFGETEHLGLL